VGVGLPDGRGVVLHAAELPGRMPAQMPVVVASCDRHDADLVAEPNMMHAAERVQLEELWQAMVVARTALGKRPLGLTFRPTTEDKDQRVRSLDEPLATGRLMVADAVSPMLAERADAWRPGGRCVDDILDAVQRVAEMTGAIAGPSASLWSDVAAGLR